VAQRYASIESFGDDGTPRKCEALHDQLLGRVTGQMAASFEHLDESMGKVMGEIGLTRSEVKDARHEAQLAKQAAMSAANQVLAVAKRIETVDGRLSPLLEARQQVRDHERRITGLEDALHELNEDTSVQSQEALTVRMKRAEMKLETAESENRRLREVALEKQQSHEINISLLRIIGLAVIVLLGGTGIGAAVQKFLLGG
jgi:chromosome segregation ATPase